MKYFALNLHNLGRKLLWNGKNHKSSSFSHSSYNLKIRGTKSWVELRKILYLSVLYRKEYIKTAKLFQSKMNFILLEDYKTNFL